MPDHSDPSPARDYAGLCERAMRAGLSVRGAYHPAQDDELLLAVTQRIGTIVMLGFTGAQQWPIFASAPEASDGTPDGTLPVRSFAQGKTRTYAFFLPSPGPSFQLLEVDHQTGNGGPVQTEVWGTDGTPAGTLRLADLGADTFLELSILWDGKLLFDLQSGSDISESNLH